MLAGEIGRMADTAEDAGGRVTLLGVGCGVPDADRDFTSLLWHGGGGRPLLIDAGGSPYVKLLRAGVEPTELGGILLTHSHCDHVSGLAPLLFSTYLAGRRDPADPIPVYGLEPTLEIARRIVEAFALDDIAAPVAWTRFAAGDTLPLPGTDRYVLRTAPTLHSRPCVALRFEDGETGAAVAYSCDTAPCPPVEELARGAGVWIHEATTPGPFPSHTSPRQAGESAARAGVGRLVLVHYSPRWTMPEADALAEVRAGGFRGPAEIGREMVSFAVTPVRPEREA